jgi:hypothetical protein
MPGSLITEPTTHRYRPGTITVRLGDSDVMNLKLDLAESEAPK